MSERVLAGLKSDINFTCLPRVSIRKTVIIFVRTDAICLPTIPLKLPSGDVFAKVYGMEGEERLLGIEEFLSLDMQKFGLEEESICENKISLQPNILLTLLEKKIKEEKFVEPNLLSPVYLRNSQAEENLKKNLKN